MQSLNQSAIKYKLGLLNLAAELGNVSRACKVMGLSRDTSTATKLRCRKAAWKRSSSRRAASLTRRTG
jgi:hypothetical protein